MKWKPSNLVSHFQLWRPVEVLAVVALLVLLLPFAARSVMGDSASVMPLSTHCSPTVSLAQVISISSAGYHSYSASSPEVHNASECTVVTIQSNDVHVLVTGIPLRIELAELSAAYRNISVRIRGVRHVVLDGVAMVSLPTSITSLQSISIRIENCSGVVLWGAGFVVLAGTNEMTLQDVDVQFNDIEAKYQHLFTNGNENSYSASALFVAHGFAPEAAPSVPLNSGTVLPAFASSTLCSQNIAVVVHNTRVVVTQWSAFGQRMHLVSLEPQPTINGTVRNLTVVFENVSMVMCPSFPAWDRHVVFPLSASPMWYASNDVSEWCGPAFLVTAATTDNASMATRGIPQTCDVLSITFNAIVLVDSYIGLRNVSMRSSYISRSYMLTLNGGAFVRLVTESTQCEVRLSSAGAALSDRILEGLQIIAGFCAYNVSVVVLDTELRCFSCSGQCFWDKSSDDLSSSITIGIVALTLASTADGSMHGTDIRVQNSFLLLNASGGNFTTLQQIDETLLPKWWCLGVATAAIVSISARSTAYRVHVANASTVVVNLRLHTSTKNTANASALTFSKAIGGISVVAVPSTSASSVLLVSNSHTFVNAIDVPPSLPWNTSLNAGIVVGAGFADVDIFRILPSFLVDDPNSALLFPQLWSMASARGLDLQGGSHVNVSVSVRDSSVRAKAAIAVMLTTDSYLAERFMPSLLQNFGVIGISVATVSNGTYQIQNATSDGCLFFATKLRSWVWIRLNVMVLQSSAQSVIQAMGTTLVTWRQVVVTLAGSTLRMNRSITGASSLLPQSAFFGIGWPATALSTEVNSDQANVGSAHIVSVSDSDFVLADSSFESVRTILQPNMTGSGSGNRVFVLGCNGYRNISEGKTSAALIGLRSCDLEAVGVALNSQSTSVTFSTDRTLLPLMLEGVAPATTIVNCSSSTCQIESLTRSETSHIPVSTVSAVVVGTLVGGLSVAGVPKGITSGLNSLQMIFRQASLTAACGGDTTDPDNAFQGDPLNNPLQIGSVWILNRNTAGIPVWSVNAVGSVIGGVWLIGLSAVLSYVQAVLAVKKVQPQIASYAGGQWRRAWYLCGGAVSSWKSGWDVLAQPILSSGVGLLVAACAAASDVSEVVWLTLFGLVGVFVVLSPLGFWVQRVCVVWRSDATFPFRWRLARRQRGGASGCLHSRVWRAICQRVAPRGEYHLKLGLMRSQREVGAVTQFVPVFDAFRIKRRWYFAVDGGLWNVLAALLTGTTWSVTWCGVGPLVSALLVALGPVATSLWLRPYCSEAEWVSGLITGSIAVVAAVLLICGQTTAAADVSLWAAASFSAVTLCCVVFNHVMAYGIGGSALQFRASSLLRSLDNCDNPQTKRPGIGSHLPLFPRRFKDVAGLLSLQQRRKAAGSQTEILKTLVYMACDSQKPQ